MPKPTKIDLHQNRFGPNKPTWPDAGGLQMRAQSRKNRFAPKSTRPVGAVGLLLQAKVALDKNRQGLPTRGCSTGRRQECFSAPGRSQPAVPRFGAPRNRATFPFPSKWTEAHPSTADTGPQQTRWLTLPRNRNCATRRLQCLHGASVLPQQGVSKNGAPPNRAQFFSNPVASPESRERR